MGASEFLAGFFTLVVLKVAVVNIVSGTLLGYSIGFIGVYDQLVKTNENCTLYQSNLACTSLQHTLCEWDYRNGTCVFSDIECNTWHLQEDACKSHSACTFDSKSKLCQHNVGFDSVKMGMFAGSMIVGSWFMSVPAGNLVDHIGRKKSIILVGIFGLLGSILVHIARGSDVYALLIIGRVVIGVSGAMACVACPVYCNEMSPEAYRGPVGTLFQVFITLGIVIAALIGVMVNPAAFDTNLHMEARIQMFIAMYTIFSVLTIVTGVVVPESIKFSKDSGNEMELQKEKKNSGVESSSVSWCDVRAALMAGVVLSLAQQFTGINAIMTYAPSITKSMGLKPMIGNVVVMTWNFLTALVSIPLASRWSMRRMFLVGTLVASLSCLCTGIPVYPGVTTKETHEVLVGFGIMLFIAAFEIGMGPSYYILAQTLFPESFRSKGCGWTLMVSGLFVCIITVCFPIAVTNLSGGPSGNQDKGMGIAFIFFGVVDLLSWVILIKTLHPHGSNEYESVK